MTICYNPLVIAVNRLVFILLLAFLVSSLFGASLIMDKMENMPGCPFMNETASLCQMNLLEHINRWQSIFMLNIISLLILVWAVLSLSKVKQNPSVFFDFYKRKNFVFQLFNNLLLVFSRGLLHSKSF